MKKKVTFYRVMNGYEFIEFMRNFGWRNNGKYQKPHPDLFPMTTAYRKLSDTRKKFEGWDFWFGRCFPTDFLNEETEITYTINVNGRNDTYKRIKDILLKNGFAERIEGE